MALTALPAAGAKLRASVLSALITEVRPLLVVKTADETVNNSATFQNDDHLFVPVAANATYVFRHQFDYNSGATPDLKSQFTVPAGCTMLYWTQASISTHAANGLTQASTVVYDGDGSEISVMTVGTITTGVSAGTVQWQWAQNAANASNTIVRAGSLLELTRIS